MDALPEISAQKKENERPMVIINRCFFESLGIMLSSVEVWNQTMVNLEKMLRRL